MSLTLHLRARPQNRLGNLTTKVKFVISKALNNTSFSPKLQAVKHLLTLFFVLAGSLLFAQSEADKEKALDLGRQAIKLMDDGQYAESLRLLEEAKALDPDNSIYPYEIGYAYYLKQDYKSAIKVLKKATKKANASKEMFSMLGNSWDNIGKPKQAIKAYSDGINRFPETAIFYVELGILESRREDFTKAAAYWERGVQIDPNYPSNYFHLATLFSNTKEHIWTVLYGEMFLNLEPGTARTEQVSELVYGGYRKAVKLENDTARVNFVQNMTMTITDLETLKLPAPMIFGTTMLLGTVAVTGEEDLNGTVLHNLRQSFLENWYLNSHDETYPNAVISRMKAIADAGHLEAYNHWLVSEGDPVGWEFWVDAHKEEFSDFVEWFNANSVELKPGKGLTRASF